VVLSCSYDRGLLCGQTLMQKMSVGVFDSMDEQPWTRLGAESVNSSASQAVAYEAALRTPLHVT
jgi:hypothetical protein